MRLEPLSVILDKGFKVEKKFYFISGSEVTLIQKIKSSIIEKYKKKEEAVITTIESINDFFDMGGLFEEKKIFVVNNCKGVEERSLDNFRNANGIFIFVQENSQKIKSNLILDSQKFLKNKKISEITFSQKKATENVFKRKNIPFRSFEIKKRSEKILGELFSFFILETILVGRCLNLNPYSQPAVELIKKETRKLLF